MKCRPLNERYDTMSSNEEQFLTFFLKGQLQHESLYEYYYYQYIIVAKTLIIGTFQWGIFIIEGRIFSSGVWGHMMNVLFTFQDDEEMDEDQLQSITCRGFRWEVTRYRSQES